MANFLLVCSCQENSSRGHALFELGMSQAGKLKQNPAGQPIQTNTASAALFAREFPQPSERIVIGPTGAWLLATGSWFHDAGLYSGAETKLLEHYLQHGIDALAGSLEGPFVLILGDPETEAVYIVTDIIGSHHAYFRELPSGLVVSGSPLLLATLAPTVPDGLAVREFLYGGTIFEDRTLYEDIKKLAPATVYTIHNGRIDSQQRYWHPSMLNPARLSGKQAIEELHDRLTTAVGKALRIGTNPVADLTSGYDSRALLCASMDAGAVPAAFVSGPPDSRDVLIASQIARTFDIPLTHFTTQQDLSQQDILDAVYLTDGEYNLYEYGGHIGPAQRCTATKGFEANLNGSFGEVARGYWWEIMLPHRGRLKEMPYARLSRLRYAFMPLPRFIAVAGNFDPVAHFTGIFQRNNQGLEQFPNTLQMDNSYLYARMRCWQGRIASSTDRIRPCLSPFQFRSLLECPLEIRWQDRKSNVLVMRMLNSYRRDLASIPLELGQPAIPLSIATLWDYTPYFLYYARKAKSKILARLPLPRQRPSSPPAEMNSEIHSKARELVQSSDSALLEALGAESTRHFIDSLEAGSIDRVSMERVITLEHTRRLAVGLSQSA